MGEGIIFLTCIYLLLLGGIVFMGYFLQIRKEELYFSSENEKIKLEDITVLIPFRNEAKRIGPLLECILRSEKLPMQFIFIDDHSTDDTTEKIDRTLRGINHQILCLEGEEQGKKLAIRKGIPLVNTRYILGMDADVVFRKDYFLHLEQLSEADLYILPAVHQATSWWQFFFEIDILLVNAVNAGVSGWKRPILASGANLLYTKKAFLELDRFSSHQHMPSGDDIYLLRDFRKGQADVRLITAVDAAIYTDTPNSFGEFMHQRLRWIAKTGDVKDNLSTSLAIIQVIFTGLFTLALVFFLWNWKINYFGLLFGAKAMMDMLLFLPFIYRTGRIITLLFFPLYEILFPVYSLVILLSMYTYKPIWKGRKLDNNF